MVNISTANKKFLSNYIENIDELVNKDSCNPLLLAIHELSVEKGLTEDQELLNELGKKLEDIYDTIYAENDS